MELNEEIQKQKELLYLNSLKVANNTLEGAEEDGYEVSSGLLSASASLLKLKLEDIVSDTKAGDSTLVDSLRSIAAKIKNDETRGPKSRSVHYKEA